MTDWEKIYIKNAPKLIGTCRRYVKDIQIAEDIVHESFIDAMQKMDSYKGSGSFEGWIQKIVVNRSLNYIRYEKTKQHILQNEENFADIIDEEMENTSANYKNTIISADFTQEELLEAIDTLPEHHKMVFNMYVIDGFSHQEISNELCISLGTSKSHLSRARKRIQDFLYEKASEKETSNKSKRFWIFLFPFTGNYFDKIYAKSFANFQIAPSSPFDVSSMANKYASSFTIKTPFLSAFAIKTIAISSTFIATSSIAYFSISNKKNESKILTAPITTNKSIENIKEVKKNNEIKTKNISLENDTISEIKPKKLNRNIFKREEKPIVIKKQIITRDTVYVIK